MRRAMRILVNALALFSLLLATGVVGLWVRSYWVRDSMHKMFYTGWKECTTDSGSIHYWRSAFAPSSRIDIMPLAYASEDKARWTYRRGPAVGRPLVLPIPVASRTIRLAGLSYAGWKTESDHGTHTGSSTTIPYWMPASATVLLAAVGCRTAWRLRRQASRPACPTCGYDLRATPSRCPECGAIPAA